MQVGPLGLGRNGAMALSRWNSGGHVTKACNVLTIVKEIHIEPYPQTKYLYQGHYPAKWTCKQRTMQTMLSTSFLVNLIS